VLTAAYTRKILEIDKNPPVGCVTININVLKSAYCRGVIGGQNVISFSGYCETYLNILSSWSPSELPLNSGQRLKSSAIIQPHDQISTGVAYGSPRRTSGERYHKVTTTDVSLISKSYVLARPKSANLILPVLVTRRF
jgi:hypothetical protein